MKLTDIKEKTAPVVYDALSTLGFAEFRPCQEKAITAGLFDGKNILVCTPTASGKTLVAEMAALHTVHTRYKKAVYIVPLKALGSEKYKSFVKRYGSIAKCAVSLGDLDQSDSYLQDKDIIVCTSEKLDSLIRHHAPWISQIGCIIADEIHLLNDPGRGPTLEVVITLLREIVPQAQVIGLSATIGNEETLARWLNAALVHDTWRPVELRQGTYYNGEIIFDTKDKE